MIPSTYASPKSLRLLLCACFMLMGCGLPAPDGTEAVLKARADELQPVKPSSRRDVKGALINGIILDPKIRSAASDVAASADKVRIERAALFPTVRLSFGAGSGAIGDGKGTLQLTGRQLLTDFGNTDRQVTAADVSLQIKYLTFQKAVDDAVVELIRAYNSVAIYKDLLEVRQEQLAGMQDLADHVEERITAGASSDTDLLETRKRLQSAEFQVQDAELSLADARDRLVRLSGQPEGGKVTPPRADCSMPFESNDLRIARLQVIKSELDLQTAQKSRMPRVSLSPLARAGESGGLGLNLSVDSDVLQGGAYTARANAAAHALAAAKASVEAQTRDNALDARKLKRDIAAADRRRDMLKRQIALLKKTRSLYRSQYFDLGTRTISEMLDNEEEYFERQADLVELESSDLSNRLACALMEQTLRQGYGLNSKKIYGLPLKRDLPKLGKARQAENFP